MTPKPSLEPLIREASESDAEALAAVHIRGWQWAYRGLIPDAYLDNLSNELPRRIEWWRRLLADPGRWTWVAEVDGVVAGFADACRSWDDDAEADTAMLAAIYLDQSVARRGVGRRLVEHACAELRSRGFSLITLWVLDSNSGARAFYEATGWHQDGATKLEQRPGFDLAEVRYRMAL